MPLSNKFSPFLKQCFVTIAVCCNTISHGCVAGFPAVLLPQLDLQDSIIPVTEEKKSWLASIVGITFLVGSQLIPPVMGRRGRKVAHYTVTFASILGWVTAAIATNFPVLMIGRIIQGTSFGMMLPLRSVLIGEYTSPKNRGAFLTTVSFAQASGILLVHTVGSFLTWQTTAWLTLMFPLISLSMIIASPESPSWLADKGRYDECRKTFRWLRGNGEEDELEEMIAARQNYELGRRKIKNFKDVTDVVRKNEFFKPVILMIHSYMMAEFSGGAVMACYSTVVLEIIAGSDVNASLLMIELDTQRVIFNGMAVYVIHKLRRRVMIIATGSLCIGSHLAIAIYVYLKTLGYTYSGIWLPILLVNLQFLSVATGMLSLPYVIAGEIFPLEYRAAGGSVSIVSMATSFFIISKTFLKLIDAIGLHGAYFLYAGVLTYGLIVLGFLLPETKGRTLQQIEDTFKGKKVSFEEDEARMSLRGNTGELTVMR